MHAIFLPSSAVKEIFLADLNQPFLTQLNYFPHFLTGQAREIEKKLGNGATTKIKLREQENKINRVVLLREGNIVAMKEIN